MAADLDLELLASIASGGLGRWVEDAAGRSVYVKSDDCIGCLRDLQRFFRYDDPEARPAFFAVSKYNFARSDLVPLIVTYPEDYEVVYNALKVATFLTMPSSEPLVTTNRAAQEQHMQAVREAFLAQDALAAVVGMLAEPLARHPRMDEKDAALVQLVIAFLKNLVAIPAAPAAAGSGGTAGASADAVRRVKGGMLERLFQDNVMELLLLLAQHAQQRPFRSEAPVLVEIFLHLFSGVEPQQLLDAPPLLEAQQAAQRREEEKRAAAAAAQKAAKAKAAAAAHIVRPGQQPGAGGAPRRGAAAARAAVANTAHLPRLPALPPGLGQPVMHKSLVPRHVAQAAPSRHAHSGAVYVRRHSEHSANIVVRHNPHRSELPKLSAVADAKKAVAQKRDGPDGGGSGAAGGAAAKPQLGAELLVKLNAYMQQFLDGAYDLLMGQVFKELQPGLNISSLSEADFLHFVRLATYCTRYVRLREERNLQAKLQREAAGHKGGSPAAGAGGGQGQAAAGGEQQQQQQQGQKDGEEGEEEEEASPFGAISATMGWDCFHWVTMLWILLSNMEGSGKQKNHSDKNWDLQHASVPLLKEMLLTLDLARVAGSPADCRAADRLQRRLLHDDLKESGLLPVLARLIRGYNFRFQPRSHGVDLVETLHVVLGVLDRLSSAEPGGFKVKAAVRQGGGRRQKAPAPVGEEGEEPADGKERAADGAAGSPAGTGEQAQGGSPAGGSGAAVQESGAEEDGAAAERRVGRSGDPLEDEEEAEEARRRARATREVSFEAARRIRAECAHPAIVHFYAWLLQGYRTNAPFTNHAILSFFRRIAEPRQLNLEPMLYQLSVLRLFEAILSDVSIKRAPDFQDLLSFCKQTVRSLFARMVPDLGELRQRAGTLEANLDARFAAAEGADEDGEADSAEQAARRERRLALAEIKARENAAKAMFVELLFWKGANVAEDVRNEYNWRGMVDPQEHKRRGGRRGRGSALGDDEGSDGEGQLGFASYRRKELFNAEQVEELRAEFERCNGHKDCLARLTFEFGGKWKKGQIGRQLKTMGLARGKLTERQVERLRERYEEVRGKLDCFQLLAEELNAGFTANQIKRQLTKLGIVSGRAKEKGLTAEQEERLRELFAEHGGTGRADRFDLIAEGLEGELGRLLTAAQVKRHLRGIGLLAQCKRSKQDAAFDALMAGSDEEGEGGQPPQSLGGRGGGGAGSDGGSDDDGSDASDSEADSDADSEGGFESAQEDIAGDSSDAEGAGGEAAGGSSRAQHRARQRLAKIERLQKSQRRDREESPELATRVRLGAGEASDSEGEEEEGDAEFGRRSAAAAAAASPAYSGGGGSGFVSLADSDGEEEEAGGAGASSGGRQPAQAVAAAAAKGKRGKAQQRQQPASKKQRRTAAAGGGSDAGSESEGESGGGYASAHKSEPGSDGEAATPKRASKPRRQQEASGGASGTPKGKRKAEKEPAGPSSAQKRAALAALRAKRQGGAALAPATEPFGVWQDSEAAAGEEQGAEPMDAENAAPQEPRQQPADAAAGAKPPAGGRRLKKAGGAAAAAAPAPASGFEDLEDF